MDVPVHINEVLTANVEYRVLFDNDRVEFVDNEFKLLKIVVDVEFKLLIFNIEFVDKLFILVVVVM